jgi:ribosomal protein L11 methyltransferase
MFYTCLRVTCPVELTEIFIAEISEAGFDTFMEHEAGFEAFAEGEKYNQDLLQQIRERYQHIEPLIFSFNRIEKENWNEQWEKSFEPVIVEDQCIVRAEFHKPPSAYPYEIIITPKMSFGTGHHATTWLMLKAQLELDHHGKSIMDAGCGTAILSIMACLRGAAHVEAFDIDEWSSENGHENIKNNKCTGINLRLGSIRQLTFDRKFDLVMANINKNVLLDEMDAYTSVLKPGGKLLLSGFYFTDADELIQEAQKFNFDLEKSEQRERWCSLLFILKS